MKNLYGLASLAIILAIPVGFLVPRILPRMSLPWWVILGIFAQSVPQRLVSPRTYLVVSLSWWVLLGFLLGQSFPSWSH